MNTRRDEQLDRNLRLIGGRIELPADPTPQQQARWKELPATPLANIAGEPPAIGVRSMKRNRYFAWVGSAAAAVTLAVFTGLLLVPSSRVHAGMILQSFRQSLSDGFRITFENVVVEGVRADGEVNVTFSGPVDENTTGELPVDSLYAEARVQGLPESESEGLSLEFRLVDNAAESWLYFRTDSLPASLLEEEPMLAFVENMTRNGVLLDLENVEAHRRAGPDGSGVSLETSITASVGAADHPQPVQGGDADAAPASGVTIHTHIGSSPDLEGLPAEIQEQVRAAIAERAADGQSGAFVRTHVTTSAKAVEAAEALRGSDADAAVNKKWQLRLGANADSDSAGAAVSLDSNSAPSEFERLLDDIVSGKARGQEIQRLIQALQISPEAATLTQDGNGTYLLTATQIGAGLGVAEAERAMLDKMVLRIAYREDSGLQWAELSNVGDAGGRIRFEHSPGAIDPARLQKSSVIEPGKTWVLDAGKLGSMFGIDLDELGQGPPAVVR